MDRRTSCEQPRGRGFANEAIAMLVQAPRWVSLTVAGLAAFLASPLVFAGDPPVAPTDRSWSSEDPAPVEGELPQLPETQVPPNVQVQPNGGVVVTRTPDRGVDVHARTPSGTVHAYGCDRVVFDPNDKSGPLPNGAAPPCSAPRQQLPPPPSYSYRPGYYPAYPPVGAYAPLKPRYARDPARKGALIASSLVFGLGTLAAGSTYLINVAEDGIGDCSLLESCGNRSAAAALYTMGAVMTFAPSIPRFVVGDVGMGLLWTGLRGGSFALGTAINWGSDGAFMPVTFAFLAPLALGIIDLATTPHRENLRPKVNVETASLKLDGLGPSAMVDRGGNTVPALSAMGRW